MGKATRELPRSSNQGRQTVVVVHGTQFDKPPATTGGEIAWWRPGSAFAKTLDEALAKCGAKARCWAHLKDGEPGFEWDGLNDWHSRAEAADRLRRYVRDLQARGWLVHLVGHSHGGNVIFEAVANSRKEVADWFRGRIALLGTPVFNNSAAFYAGQRRLFVTGLLLGVVVLAALAWAFGLHEARPIRGIWRHDFFGFVVIGLFCLPLFLLVERVRGKLFQELPVRLLKDGGFVKTGSRRTPQILLIGSWRDEAYKVLSALKEPRPFAHGAKKAQDTKAEPPKARPKASLWAIVRPAHRSAAARFLSQIRLTDLLGLLFLAVVVGGALALGRYWDGLSPAGNDADISGSEAGLWVLVIFVLLGYAVLFWKQLLRLIALPFLVACYLFGLVWKSVSGLVTQLIREPLVRTIKGFVRQLGYGFLGGPVSVGQVTVGLWPESAPENWLYLELPSATVDAVREQQTPKLSALVDSLYAAQAGEDSFETLAALAKELGLPIVHSAYYADPACLERIARWINRGAATDALCSFVTATFELRPGGIGVPGDYVTHPYADSWEDALLELYEPETGWGCRLPREITYELKWGDYGDSTLPRFARLYQLYLAFSGRDTDPKPMAPSRSAELKAPWRPTKQSPPPRLDRS
jgi:hypothetical protein